MAVGQVNLRKYAGARVFAYVVRHSEGLVSRFLELELPGKPRREVSLADILGRPIKDVHISTWDVQVTELPPRIEEKYGWQQKLVVRTEYGSAVLTSAATSGGRTIIYLNNEQPPNKRSLAKRGADSRKH